MGTKTEFEASKTNFRRVLRFRGIVRPERAKVSFETRRMRVKVGAKPESIRDALVEVSATDGVFELVLYSDVDHSDLLTLRNALLQLLDSIVDWIAFIEGMHLEAEFISVQLPDSSIVIFETVLPVIRTHAQTRGVRSGVGQEFRKDIDSLFRRALADFKKAMKYVNDVHFYCHRSVETLLHFYSRRDGIDPKKKKDLLWKTLKSDLNLTEKDFSKLKSWSEASRHGEQVFTDELENVESLKLTWDVLYNFLEKRRAELPVNLF